MLVTLVCTLSMIIFIKICWGRWNSPFLLSPIYLLSFWPPKKTHHYFNHNKKCKYINVPGVCIWGRSYFRLLFVKFPNGNCICAEHADSILQYRLKPNRGHSFESFQYAIRGHRGCCHNLDIHTRLVQLLWSLHILSENTEKNITKNNIVS